MYLYLLVFFFLISDTKQSLFLLSTRRISYYYISILRCRFRSPLLEWCMRETKENVTGQINASFYKWELSHWIYSNWKRNTDVELWVTSKGQKYLSILFYPLLAQKEVIEQDRNIFFVSQMLHLPFIATV